MHIATARGCAGRSTDRELGRAGHGTETHRTRSINRARRGMGRMTPRESPPLIKLNPVTAGAGVSIVAPASFARQERVDLGMTALGRLGYAPQFATHAQARGPL